MSLDRGEIGLRRVVGTPLPRRQHRVEAFGVEVALIDFVPRLTQANHDRVPQRRREAVA